MDRKRFFSFLTLQIGKPDLVFFSRKPRRALGTLVFALSAIVVPAKAQIVPNYHVYLEPGALFFFFSSPADLRNRALADFKKRVTVVNPYSLYSGSSPNFIAQLMASGAGQIDRTKSASGAAPAQERDNATSQKPVVTSQTPNLMPPVKPEGFHWGRALGESLLLTVVMHGKRLSESKTRSHIGGPFFKGWWFSISHIDRWQDGLPGHEDPWSNEYLYHPINGAIFGYQQILNDPKGRSEVFGRSRGYWMSRFKAFWWSSLWSIQWKMGPLSEASIGHVKQGYIDYALTSTIGTAWIIGEDMLERYIVLKFEAGHKSHVKQAILRWACSPTRAAANAFHFRVPWSRYGRPFGSLYQAQNPDPASP